ncbi:Gfo/Idh/MocA family protein [Granulicoccus phenolivorans]|uniref:Gfo/Idh/MocA family protein n=1 Tax=Granulicoccus phenolivorans TaxID=266854 RepID=UPI000478DC89|nr:Gfo/Idh/MocA family oxidoreductase [Granulicoccus phenolivorans]
MRIGLVGYGLGGRIFHAPYIAAAEGVELVGVVTGSPVRRKQLAEDFPGMAVYDSLTDLLDAGVDAVTITTPPQTRRALVLEALARGVAVVADKPFAPNAAEGQELVDAAEAARVPLAVFHNRRWDTDLRTLRDVLDGGELGSVRRVESRFDLDSPETIDPGPNGGVLRDLGAHLADQLLWLLGPVTQVYAALDWIEMPEGRTDTGFTVTMRHLAGPVSTMVAGKANHARGRELRVYAEAGSYRSTMGDVQTEAILAGRRPVLEGDRWGYADEAEWGTLSTAGGVDRVPSSRGAYQDFYSEFARAVAGEGDLPVTGAEAVRTLRVLDAAQLSDSTGQAVPIS